MQPELLRQRLKLAVEVFRADQTVLRVVRKQQIEDRAARVDRPQRIGVNLHSFRHRGAAGRGEIRAALDFDHADAAGAGAVLEVQAVHFHMAEGRNADVEQLGRFQNRGPGFDGNRGIVDLQIDFHIRKCSSLSVAQCFSTAWNLQTP